MTDATVLLVKELWAMRICYRGGLEQNLVKIDVLVRVFSDVLTKDLLKLVVFFAERTNQSTPDKCYRGWVI